MAPVAPTFSGQLFIWTDVDPAHEPDFNRWYDREHMQERTGIPGFLRARRFRSVVACPRRYLALYDTESLAVFRTSEYQKAFAQQTDWSRRNFARMRDTQRRVGELTVDEGMGEGGALALFVFADDRSGARLAPHFRDTVERDHVIRASLLETDVGLSAPLSAGAAPAGADRVAMVEATDGDAAFDAADNLARQLAVDVQDGGVHVFRLLWRL
jgi:hypothetical protein